MKLHFIVLLSALVVFSCRKDDPIDVEAPASASVIRVNPKFGSDALELDHTYALNDSTDIQIVELKFYLSSITSNGVQKKDYSLFDFRERGTLLYSAGGAPGNFTSFNALVGVPESVNHSDPSAFPEGSALSTLIANDMYWGWSGGYIFLKIEAKADTIPDGIANFDHSIVYHVATDGFSGNLSFPAVNWQTYSTTSFLDFKVDLFQVFNNVSNRIEVRSEFQTPHAPAAVGSLTEKVMNNFIAAFSLQ